MYKQCGSATKEDRKKENLLQTCSEKVGNEEKQAATAAPMKKASDATKASAAAGHNTCGQLDHAVVGAWQTPPVEITPRGLPSLLRGYCRTAT